jgi:hypothetical protein
MEVSGQLHVPAALPPKRKSPWYPLDRSLGGPQSRSGRGGEEKNSQPLPGLYTTDLSRKCGKVQILRNGSITLHRNKKKIFISRIQVIYIVPQYKDLHRTVAAPTVTVTYWKCWCLIRIHTVDPAEALCKKNKCELAGRNRNETYWKKVNFAVIPYCNTVTFRYVSIRP